MKKLKKPFYGGAPGYNWLRLYKIFNNEDPSCERPPDDVLEDIPRGSSVYTRVKRDIDPVWDKIKPSDEQYFKWRNYVKALNIYRTYLQRNTGVIPNLTYKRQTIDNYSATQKRIYQPRYGYHLPVTFDDLPPSDFIYPDYWPMLYVNHHTIAQYNKWLKQQDYPTIKRADIARWKKAARRWNAEYVANYNAGKTPPEPYLTSFMSQPNDEATGEEIQQEPIAEEEFDL